MMIPKKYVHPLFIVSVIGIMLPSCKKETAMSKTALLSNGAWFFERIRIQDDTGQWYDQTPSDVCWKDNYYFFYDDNSYQHNEGDSKCNGSDPQVIDSGTWQFINDESGINFTGSGGLGFDWIIQELNENYFKMSSTYTDNGRKYKREYAYIHK